MSDSKHTPGPWSIKRSTVMHDGEYDFAINAEGAPILAEAFGRSSDGGLPPAEANARLIAAAPELLEALKYARRFLRGIDHDVDLVDAAIAKAGG